MNENFPPLAPIKKDDINVCVIGLGYVGGPLLARISKFFRCSGLDIDRGKIADLKAGIDSTGELSGSDLEALSNLELGSDVKDFHNTYNFYIVTVPTPINADKSPDLKPLMAASEQLGRVLKSGDTVVYESTVYPGVTEDVCVPILEKVSGLTRTRDFYFGYSPERINPGDKGRQLKDICKVTSGCCVFSASLIDWVYRTILDNNTHLAPSVAVAEASKVIENAQRDLNIAFINEISIILSHLDIPTRDVLAAASTKWNFFPFEPGLVGGHCIGVDPYYLIAKSIEVGYNPELLENARRINEGMISFLYNLALKNLPPNKVNTKLRCFVYGLAFKRNCPDFRNSKAVEMANYLVSMDCSVGAWDHCVDIESVRLNCDRQISMVSDPQSGEFDVVFILVDHDGCEDFLISLCQNNLSAVVIDLNSISSRIRLRNRVICV